MQLSGLVKWYILFEVYTKPKGTVQAGFDGVVKKTIYKNEKKNKLITAFQKNKGKSLNKEVRSG